MSNRELTSKELLAKIAERDLLKKPSLKGLAYLLRHKELWPEGFEWRWDSSLTCAIGLARQYWSLHLPFQSLQGALNMSDSDYGRCFLCGSVKPWYCFWRDISPEDVARRIERRLLKGDQT